VPEKQTRKTPSTRPTTDRIRRANKALKEWMPARVASLYPQGLATGSRGRDGLESFCRTLALRRASLVAIRARQDSVRPLLCRRWGTHCWAMTRRSIVIAKSVHMRVCVSRHMTSVDGTDDWEEAGMHFLAGRISFSPRSPHICNRNAYFATAGGAKSHSLLIYWMHRLVRAPSISPRIQARVQRRPVGRLL
jgi:hypothetical protein